jgi:outer membrane protein assembly factor BamB
LLTPSWTTDLPSPPIPGAAVDLTRGYVALRSDALVAVTLETGAVSWSVPTEPVVAPLVAGEGLVFLAHARNIEAVDADSGARRWRADLEAPVSAPLVRTGIGLVVPTESGVTMLRAASGDVLWVRALGAPPRIQPAADNDRIYVALDDGRVTALAAGTGRTAWETPPSSPATTIDTSEGRVFVGADKFLSCLSADRGKRKWRWRTGAAPVGRVATDKHHVYFVALDNVLRALDRGHGQQAWKAPLAHRPLGGVFLAARLLWVPGIAGEVAGFQTVDGSAIGVSALAGDPAAAPQLRVSPAGAFEGVFVVSGDGQAQWLVPGPPPLPAKAIPGLPMGLPEIKGALSKGQPAIGAF